MKLTRAKIKTTLCASFYLMILSNVAGCAENPFEKTFLNAAQNAKKKKQNAEINFQSVDSKRRITKICIQGSYITKKAFEEIAEISVKKIPELDDSKYALWIFFEEATPLILEFSRGTTMVPHPDSPACSASPLISVESQNSSATFQLVESK